MEDDEIVREFLSESFENLARLDREMVELEQHPDRQELLASIFRTIHTIKGTCGFLGFTRLEALAHVGEDILNELRQHRRRLDGPLTSLILQSVDAIKRILDSIQAGMGEGEAFEGELIQQLKSARDGQGLPQPPTEVLNPSATFPDERSEAPLQQSENETPVPTNGDSSVGNSQAATPSNGSSNLVETALRVDVGLLDRLMNLVGELVLARNQFLQYSASREDAALNTIFPRLNHITSDLQEGVMKMRMQPIGVVWNKLPRIVRDLSKSLGKEIDLEMEGVGTELDRTIIEAYQDPLTHIVRNVAITESRVRTFVCRPENRGEAAFLYARITKAGRSTWKSRMTERESTRIVSRPKPSSVS